CSPVAVAVGAPPNPPRPPCALYFHLAPHLAPAPAAPPFVLVAQLCTSWCTIWLTTPGHPFLDPSPHLKDLT
ncbi:hypothetical protein FB451DRAFT_1558259, partial [Mycena latifolia]